VRMLPLSELLSFFPSLAGAPRELAQLSAWFGGAGPTEQAAHAAALVLQLAGAKDIEFSEAEALHVWDQTHQGAYLRLQHRLREEGAALPAGG
jgi:hypothetical protein